jgi:lipopolysaccharide biosynthesis glycosyltransferase
LKDKLSNTSFETEINYARFYFTEFFEMTKFVYIDNDAIVTMDLIEFISYPMFSKGIQRSENGDILNRNNEINDIYSNESAAVAFVFEKAIFYKFYMETHMHTNDAIVKRAIKIHGDKVFFNGGVVLADSARWKEGKWTGKAEKLIAENYARQLTKGSRALFDTGIGEQGKSYCYDLCTVILICILLQGRSICFSRNTLHIYRQNVI